MNDMEDTARAMLTANSLLGTALAALQRFVTVVATYFPARPAMAAWLAALHAWIHGHEDALRGEDLSAWMTASFSPHGLQAAGKYFPILLLFHPPKKEVCSKLPIWQVLNFHFIF